MLDFPWYVYALLSAACTPFVVLLEKRGVTRESPVRFLTGVTVIGALVSAPFLPFVAWENITPELFLLMVVVALLSGIGCAISLIAMRNLEAGEVSAILALTPAVTTLAALVALGEAPSMMASIGVATIVLGLLILEFPRLRGLFSRMHPTHALGYVGLALCAVLVYSASALADRMTLSSGQISPFDFIVVVQVLLGIMFFVVSLTRRTEGFSFIGAITRQPVTIGSLVLIEFLSRVLYSRAVSMAYVGLVASLKRVNVIVTIVLAGRLFHEEGIVRKLIAALCIIVGVSAIIL